MVDDFVNDVSVAMSSATETPRVLKEWRAQQQPYMSQVRAADVLKVPHRSYVRWEAGENIPHRTTIEKIARKIGLKPDDFYPEARETASETRQRIQRIEDMLETALANQERQITALTQLLRVHAPETAQALSEAAQAGQARRPGRAASKPRKSRARTSKRAA